MPESMMRLIGGGSALAQLLDMPQTLPALGLASRACDHQPVTRAVFDLGEAGEALTWCGVCGAASRHNVGEEPEFWQPSTVAALITREILDRYVSMTYGIAELVRAIEGLWWQAHDGGDLAFSCVDEVRAHQAALEGVAAAARELIADPNLKAAELMGALAEVIFPVSG